MINKPATEPQATVPVSAPVAAVTAAAKPAENTTAVTETVATTSAAAGTAPEFVASGIELNVPVEKIEAEKKSSTIGVSQPPSTAAATARVEPREPSSAAQSNSAKKDKKEKKRKFVRMAAGTVWEDQTLGDWDLGELLVFSGSMQARRK